MTGQNVDAARVDFGQKLTVVRGPSDTGKSFIVDAIDFALGGSSLKEVPEREGYDSVMLGVATADGDSYTLVRSVRGGRIGVYEEILLDRPDSPPSFALAAKPMLRPKTTFRDSSSARLVWMIAGFDAMCATRRTP